MSLAPTLREVVGRLAPRRWAPGDPRPRVGTLTLVAGINTDVDSDQHRRYSWRQVLGYSDDGMFVCLQTSRCWPTVERVDNCWFGEIPHPEGNGEELTLLEIPRHIERLTTQNEQLRAFAQEILPGDFNDCGDVDFADVQRYAVKHGLLAEVTMQERCGERCQCAEVDGDFPLRCYRFTEVYTGRRAAVTS